MPHLVRRRDVVLQVLVAVGEGIGGGGCAGAGQGEGGRGFHVAVVHWVVGAGVGEGTVGADVKEEEEEGGDPWGGVSWV